MLLMVANSDLHVSDHGYEWDWKAPKTPSSMTLDEIMVGTHTFGYSLRNRTRHLDREEVEAQVKFPPLLTREVVQSPPDKKIVTLCVINGVGSGVGDCIGGLCAMKKLYDEFWRRGRRLVIDLIVQDGKWIWANELYYYVPYINLVQPHAMPLSRFTRYDLYADTENYVVEMDASGLHMYDFMCRKFCVDEAGPHLPELWVETNAYDQVSEALECVPKPRAVLNLFASCIRRIPKFYAKKLARLLAEQYNVILVSRFGDAEETEWLEHAVGHECRDRIVNLTPIVSRSLHHLIALADQVDYVVTPDTGLLHICGVTGVPTTAVFYSIEPNLRCRDFPNVAPFCPEVFRKGPHWGQHKPLMLEAANMDPKEYERLMALYADPEQYPGWKQTWQKVTPEEILATTPGPRQPSRVIRCPTREDRLCFTSSSRERSTEKPDPSGSSAPTDECTPRSTLKTTPDTASPTPSGS